jgi:hypothetical protein
MLIRLFPLAPKSQRSKPHPQPFPEGEGSKAPNNFDVNPGHKMSKSPSPKERGWDEAPHQVNTNGPTHK